MFYLDRTEAGSPIVWKSPNIYFNASVTSKFLLLCLAFEEGYYLYYLIYSTSEVLSEENITIANGENERRGRKWLTQGSFGLILLQLRQFLIGLSSHRCPKSKMQCDSVKPLTYFNLDRGMDWEQDHSEALLTLLHQSEKSLVQCLFFGTIQNL